MKVAGAFEPFVPLRALKERVRGDLVRRGWWPALKSSFVFELYLRTWRRDWLRERTREVEFFRRLLQPAGDRGPIFDIGANVGNKTEVFQFVAPVVCVEPDPANASFLRHRFGRKAVVVVEKAVSDRPGTVTFTTFEESALNTLSSKWVDIVSDEKDVRFDRARRPVGSREVQATTLDELIATHGVPRFAKVDVEGHEANVFRGLSRPIPFMSFEVNLPEFRDEAVECVERIASLCPGARFNYVVGARAHGTEMPQWLAAPEFKQWLAKTDLDCFDVFADSTASPS